VLDLGHFANTGLDDFSQWLPQNDFQFDPQLFGGYRDPQENILSSGFDDSFFNDALDVDFVTPYNLPITSPPAPKKDLIAQIDAAKEDDESAPTNQLLKCNDVWYVWLTRNLLLRRPTNRLNREKISKCPKAQSGDFDLDGLCADLQKKAKCDGTGPVISHEDFQVALKKYLCKDDETTAAVDAAAKKMATQSKA
jgi:AP-1-like factor